MWHTTICWQNVEVGGRGINHNNNYSRTLQTLLQSPVVTKTNHNNITLYSMTCTVISTNQHHNIYTTSTTVTHQSPVATNNNHNHFKHLTQTCIGCRSVTSCRSQQIKTHSESQGQEAASAHPSRPCGHYSE